MMLDSMIKIIDSVKIPIGFLTVLVGSFVGIFLNVPMTESNITVLIIAMMVVLSIALWVFYFPNKDKTLPRLIDDNEWNSNNTYDLFISVPIASFGKNRIYQSSQQSIKSLIPIIKEKCQFQDIFYAGENINSQDDFEDEALALKNNYSACLNSKYFMLVYPQKNTK
ncbi:hypothetical protein CRYPA_1403 [uncultured Candidatus Thioglobus sp.]|nr:hypothetical protein CRYPA_1403 [uncultured Candidatus Thioglobus sp.]